MIKTKSGSYYRYSLKSTLLNYILDKDFLINEIKISNERIIDDKFINFTILKNENEINVFFDLKNFNLIGWQTLIFTKFKYNLSFSLEKNLELNKDIFKLPSIN